jgi:epoxyqueuosine reductase QueG
MPSLAEYRTSRIKEVLIQQGARYTGIADILSLGLPITNQYRFAICFALRYNDEVVDQLPNDVLWGKTASSLTKRAMEMYQSVQRLIESWGYHHSRIPSTTRIDQLPDPGEELPQKTIATLSGLGWIGKSSLLITPTDGPRVRLGTLLTAMPLEVDNPVVQDRCEQCSACVRACPVGAIKGNSWSPGIPRSSLLDVRRCYDHLWNEKPTLGRRQICGICLKVCPVGQRSADRISIEPAPTTEHQTIGHPGA